MLFLVNIFTNVCLSEEREREILSSSGRKENAPTIVTISTLYSSIHMIWYDLVTPNSKIIASMFKKHALDFALLYQQWPQANRAIYIHFIYNKAPNHDTWGSGGDTCEESLRVFLLSFEDAHEMMMFYFLFGQHNRCRFIFSRRVATHSKSMGRECLRVKI